MAAEGPYRPCASHHPRCACACLSREAARMAYENGKHREDGDNHHEGDDAQAIADDEEWRDEQKEWRAAVCACAVRGRLANVPRESSTRISAGCTRAPGNDCELDFEDQYISQALFERATHIAPRDPRLFLFKQDRKSGVEKAVG